MSERKIRFAPNHVGGWWAFIDDIGVASEMPWEASAALAASLNEDIAIEWETLPWTTLRLAHGITEGVTSILGASREARRAIDAANYAEEMRELGVSRYVTLTAKERAELAAAAAERLIGRDWSPVRGDAELALKWTQVAAEHLDGYGPVVRFLRNALHQNYPGTSSGNRRMRLAARALVAANARNDIAPDSRYGPPTQHVAAAVCSGDG